MDDPYQKVGREIYDEDLSRQSILRLKISSQSMSPLLLRDDYVLVKSTSEDDYQRGDILVTRRLDGYLTHRLIAVNEHGWITKGDRNCQADAAIRKQDILGLVIAYERDGKSYSLQTQSRRVLSRVQGWLGWKEANCHSQIGAQSIRILAKVLQILSGKFWSRANDYS